MLFLFSKFSSLFICKGKHYGNDNDSISLSMFVANGAEQLKTILTTNNPSNDDDRTKYYSIV